MASVNTSLPFTNTSFFNLETTGLPRLLEALAANQWDNDDADLSLADIDLEDLEDTTQDDDEDTLAKVIDADSIDEQELYRPIFAQKEPGGKDGGEEPESDEEELAGEDAQVEALQRMMLKMQAVRGVLQFPTRIRCLTSLLQIPFLRFPFAPAGYWPPFLLHTPRNSGRSSLISPRYLLLTCKIDADMGANMPEQERRKFAAQSVRKLMKEL